MEVYLPEGGRYGRAILIRRGAFLKGNTKSSEKLTIGSISGTIYSGLEDALLGATKDWCNA